MANITARTQLFAEGLPAEHPLRSRLANLLKEARIQDDLFARATVLEGALNMRPGALSKRPVATLPDIQQNFPDINPQFFDMRRDYDLYGAVIGGAGQIKGTSYTSDEIAQALIAGLTIVNMDEVSGGSIYRRLGKKLANALKAGRVDMKGLAGTLRSWAKARAMDVIDSRRDVSIDEGFGDEGFDQASMIDRFYSDPGTSETALSISVVNKPGMLQTIDRAVRKELRGPGQEAVWDAVLNDPGLLNPSARGMGIDQQPLAEAVSRMTGTEISRQVAGRTFRDKVLPAMERALANDEKLQQTLMKDRDIQQVFQDAMRLARTAEWKGWTEDMPVQVVTMKGTEVFPNLAAAQKKYRDLDPRRNGRKFTWAMKDRVKGRPAIRFEAWDVNRMMSMSASSKSGKSMAGPWYATTSNRAGVTRFFLGKNKAAATRWLRGISRSSDDETQVSALFQPRASVDLAFASRSKGLDRKDKQLLFLARSVYDNWEVALRDFQQQGTTRSEDVDFMEQYTKNLRMASLRERAIRLASENPELRRRLLPLLKHDQLQELLKHDQLQELVPKTAEKAKTEEGAKKLHEEYMKGLKDPSKSTKRPEDFFEKPEGDEGGEDAGSQKTIEKGDPKPKPSSTEKEEKQEEKPKEKKEPAKADPKHTKAILDLNKGNKWYDEEDAEADVQKINKAIEKHKKDIEGGDFVNALAALANQYGSDWDEVKKTLIPIVKELAGNPPPQKVSEHGVGAAKALRVPKDDKGDLALKGQEALDLIEDSNLSSSSIMFSGESMADQINNGMSVGDALRHQLGATMARVLNQTDDEKRLKAMEDVVGEFGEAADELGMEWSGTVGTRIDSWVNDNLKKASLRTQAIKLAHENPELRAALLPLLASEQEAEKFEAESEAAEDQSQADEAKAEAARVKEAGRTPSGTTIFSEREPLEKAMKELVEMDYVYFADPRKRMRARDIEKDLQELLATHYAEESIGYGRSRDPGGDVFNPKDILLDVEWVPNIEDGISGWEVSFSPRFDPRVAKTAAAKLKQTPEDTDFDIQF